MLNKIKMHLKDGSTVLMDRVFNLDIPEDLGIELESDLAWDKAMWPVSDFFAKLGEGSLRGVAQVAPPAPPSRRQHPSPSVALLQGLFSRRAQSAEPLGGLLDLGGDAGLLRKGWGLGDRAGERAEGRAA